ncbi:MAG: hypothetical protein E4H40_07640 [Candidatus Brocadiia bacterium]|nr:MAG: hypothetical protein E4H40_07640 [Candidatus Brocadiia bacterium]
MYCYADIHSIALTGSDLSEPDGQTTIRIVLNGTFPGTMPNPYLPPNPDRMFDTLYSLNIDSTTSHGQIMMRIWRETALGPTQTFAWYDGPYSGYIGSLLVLDNELVGDPNEITDETIITNNTLELTVSNSLFFDPGSDPFEGQVALSAQSTVNDGGIILNDSAQDIDGPFFELSLALPDETPSIYLLGPSTDPNGRGLGITGHGLTQNTLVQINLDGESIG